MKPFTQGLAGIALVWLGFPAGVSAETVYTWTGGGGADVNWTTPANWGVAAYPNGAEDVVVFTNAATLTLDADVQLKLLDLRGGGATVTIGGTNTITVSSSTFIGIGARDVNDRLVIYPKVVKAAGSNPNDRLYCNTDSTKLGTVVFRNTVLIPDLSAAFAVNNGKLELSGDADVRTTSETYNNARLFMSQLAPAGAETSCRLKDSASLKLAYLDLAWQPTGYGRVYQDGTGTVVSLSKALVVGQSFLLTTTATSASPMSRYDLNNGSLTVGSLYCGYKLPGTFLMTNGTLTAAKIIVGRRSATASSG